MNSELKGTSSIQFLAAFKQTPFIFQQTTLSNIHFIYFLRSLKNLLEISKLSHRLIVKVNL